MARDYNRRGSTHKSSQAGGQILLALTAFLLGYLTASVVDINSVGHWIDNQVKNSQDKPHTASKAVEEPRVHQPTAAKPKFEFYTLLTKEQRAANLQHQNAGTPTTTPAQAAKPPVQVNPQAAPVNHQTTANSANTA